MSDNTFFIGLANVGGALGRGLIAGVAGTVAITLSQMIEMQITGREGSDAPMKVGGKVLGVEARGKAELEVAQQKENSDTDEEALQEKVAANKAKFSQLMHYAYGTGWGVFRSVLDLAGVRGPAATLAHFGAIWGAAQVMLPAADASEPITEWSPKQIAIDVLHHAVYALAAGAVYDAMPRGRYGSKRRWFRKRSF